MVRTHVITIVLALLVTLASAQTPATAPATAPAGYTGRVTGENVYVRSGPRLNFYPVLKLSAPAEVRVLGTDGEWLKIAPPAGAFSLISKEYVRAEGDVGTVTGDRVRVRAGSMEQPAMFTQVQGYLNANDTVTIIGATEEYYKIAPPEGAALYVNAKYVKRVMTTTSTALAATRPATQPATRPATQPAAPTPEQIMAKVVEAFKVAEAALMAEYAKPAAQRDLPGLVKMYEAIEAPADSPLMARAKYRVRYLQLAIRKLKGKAQVQALATEAARQKKALAADRAALTGAAPPPARRADVTATGRLAPSRLYSGDGGRPKRWMLLDQMGGMILMYVETATAQRDLADSVGWKVNLTGRRTYDPALQCYVLHVRRVQRVAGGEPVAPPRRPQPGPLADSDVQPRSWGRPDFGPIVAAPTSPDGTSAQALPVVPAIEAAPPVVDPEEYK